MAKYGRKTQNKVRKVMHERKHGELKSGSGRKVKSRKQAIAIALSEARREGDKVPPRKGRKKSTSRKGRSSGSRTSSRSRKSGSRKSSSRSRSSSRKRSRK